MKPIISPSDRPLLSNVLGISEANRERLDKTSHTLKVKKNTTPICKGDKVSGAYVVTKGCLRVFTFTPNGNESTFYLIKPGEACVFAINCLFNQLLYPAWVSAEEDTEISVIHGTLFKQLFQTEAAIQSLTIDALSTAVFKLMIEVEQLQGWNLSQRLANLLLNESSDENILSMTQQEIAARLGSTREVVARVLAEMSALGWISTGRGKVNVIRADVLAASLSE